VSQPRGIRRYNDLAGTNLDRLAGISDGIFAVGMTLLVLGLVVPAVGTARTDSDLWQALLRLGVPTWVSITLIVLVQLNYVLAPRIPLLHRF
jgi:hypothetical protein